MNDHWMDLDSTGNPCRNHLPHKISGEKDVLHEPIGRLSCAQSGSGAD